MKHYDLGTTMSQENKPRLFLFTASLHDLVRKLEYSMNSRNRERAWGEERPDLSLSITVYVFTQLLTEQLSNRIGY